MLLQLGQTSEAKILVERARKIAPEDQRVVELLDIIGRAAE